MKESSTVHLAPFRSQADLYAWKGLLQLADVRPEKIDQILAKGTISGEDLGFWKICGGIDRLERRAQKQEDHLLHLDDLMIAVTDPTEDSPVLGKFFGPSATEETLNAPERANDLCKRLDRFSDVLCAGTNDTTAVKEWDFFRLAADALWLHPRAAALATSESLAGLVGTKEGARLKESFARLLRGVQESGLLNATAERRNELTKGSLNGRNEDGRAELNAVLQLKPALDQLKGVAEVFMEV